MKWAQCFVSLAGPLERQVFGYNLHYIYSALEFGELFRRYEHPGLEAPPQRLTIYRAFPPCGGRLVKIHHESNSVNQLLRFFLNFSTSYL